MKDFSWVVPWVAVAIGAAAAWFLGRQLSGRRSLLRFFACAAVAAIIGVVTVFPAVWLHSVCMGPWKLCASRGDGNMSYWFFSVAAIPLYALMMFFMRSPSADDSSF